MSVHPEPKANGQRMDGQQTEPPAYDQGMNVQPAEPQGYGQGMHGQPTVPPAYGQPMQGQPMYGPGMYGQPAVAQSQVNTTVVINQPTQVQNDKLVTSKYGHRDWSTGMFACCDDMGKCCLAVCCQELVLMDIANRTGECCCVPMCIPGGLIAIRTRLRTLGGIQGSICSDYMALSCCYICALCQMHRELDHMGL